MDPDVNIEALQLFSRVGVNVPPPLFPQLVSGPSIPPDINTISRMVAINIINSMV